MSQSESTWTSIDEVENSTAFQGLLVAAAGKPERSMGNSVIPAEPPQWPDVKKYADELIARQPMHLAVLVNLIKAHAALDGFIGLHQSLCTLADFLASDWDTLYPEPDAEDPDDPFYARVNLLRELSDEPRFIDIIYRLPLVDVRGIGTYSTRDIDIAAGILVVTDDELARCQSGLIRGAFEQTPVENLQATHDALKSMEATVVTIESLVTDKAGAENSVSLATLCQRCRDCLSRFEEFSADRLQSHEELNDDVLPEVSDESSGGVVSLVPTAVEPEKPSEFGDRKAVVEALEKIIRYYQQHEPSSPVAVLAHRASTMVTKPFFEILQELAPQQSGSFKDVLGALSNNPLAFLLDDCYQRFVGGERVPEAADQIRQESATDIQSRADVLVTIGELERFFHQREPASAIPLILSEMRKLVPKTFTELLKEFHSSRPASESTVAEASGEQETNAV